MSSRTAPHMPDGPSSLSPVEPDLLVATLSPEGEPAFRNAAWIAVLGSGRDVWHRLAPEDRRLAEQALVEAAAGGLVTNQIVPVAVADRDVPLPVLLNFLPVHFAEPIDAFGGEPDEDAFAVRAVTVTGEVLAEPTTWTENQTHRHRMETLGRMTMGIAHDFNNLLSGILGYTELVKSLSEPREPYPGFGTHLRTIEQAALDGAALVRKIQQYIRQEKRTRFEPLDLPGLVDDCIALTRPYWYNEPRRKGIAIEVDLDFGDVPPVMGAAAELREVLINLVLNAVQAMPAGGTLTFRTVLEATRGVVLTVEDTGLGMGESVRRRIFEPLFTTKGEHGTGMGLAVSYGIVQEHEGTITVDSAPGCGARFTIVLPPAEDDVVPSGPTPAPDAVAHARVLVVDDERMVRSVLARLLGLRGHTIVQAASGAEALALAEDERFDIVFTDLGMPEMNGRQFARTLRRRHPDLPVVLLTGDTDIGTAGDDVALVLTKPFKLDELQEVIRQLVGG